MWGEVVATKPPLVRAGFELNSDKVGELPIGAHVQVLESRKLPDGARRVCIALSSDAGPYGWLTGVTKDGLENLHVAVHEVVAPPPQQLWTIAAADENVILSNCW